MTHFLPFFGDLRMANILSSHVQVWVNQPRDIAVATPQHVTTASPQSRRHVGEFPASVMRESGARRGPAQIRQVRAGASLRGVERRFLAYAFPPARHTRAVWQYRHAIASSGLLPPTPAPPGQAALSFTAPLGQNHGLGKR